MCSENNNFFFLADYENYEYFQDIILLVPNLFVTQYCSETCTKCVDIYMCFSIFKKIFKNI